MGNQSRNNNADRDGIDISSILSNLNSPEDITLKDRSAGSERASAGGYEEQLRRILDEAEAGPKAPAERRMTDEEAYYAPVDEAAKAAEVEEAVEAVEAVVEAATAPAEEPAPQSPAEAAAESAEELYNVFFEEQIPEEEEEDPEAEEEKPAEDEEFDSNYYAADRAAEAQKSAPTPEPEETPEEIAEEEPVSPEKPGVAEKLRAASDKVFAVFRKKDKPEEEIEDTEEEPAPKKARARLNTDIPELDPRFGYEGKEYTSREETEQIAKAYARDKLITDVRIVATAALAIVLFIFDTFGKKFGGALSHTAYPAVQILVSLQILLIAAALSYKQLWAGICGLFTGKPTTDSVTAAAVIFTVIYDIIMACMANPEFTLYNFPACFCLLLTVLRDHLTIATQKRSFEKLSSWDSVYTLESADRADSGDAKLKRTFRLHNGKFAENYFAHTNRWDPSLKVLTLLLCVSLAASLLVFIILLAAHKYNAMQLFNTFIAQLLFTLPGYAAVASIYPFYALMYRDRASDCVVLSEPDAQEYAAVGTLVINEEDFFGKDGSIYVKQMKLCTSSVSCNICEFVPAAYSILKSIGATAALPLYKSIEKLTQEMPQVDAIRSLTENGVCGVVGGKTYYIGTEQYLADNGIAPLPIRSENSGSACRRMHIASETEDLIVYELVYSIKRRFIGNLVKLSNQGIRIVVRATDPNIDEPLMRTLTGKTSTPIKVRKNISDPTALLEDYRAALSDGVKDEVTVDGGILASGDKLNDLIDRANICAGYKKWSGVNLIAIGAAFGIGLILALLLGLNGVFVGTLSLFIVLYQLIALVPSIIIAVSKVFL